MKKALIFAMVALLTTCAFGQVKNASYYQSKGYQVFTKLRLAVKAPVKLEDVSRQAEGDFVLNYGGVEDDNKSTIAFYQIMVISLPAGYQDYTDGQMQGIVDEFLKDMVNQFTNVKRIYFGEEGCPGYVGDIRYNGYKQRAVMFYRKGYIYAITLITNYQLEQRFNKFTNGVKFY